MTPQAERHRSDDVSSSTNSELAQLAAEEMRRWVRAEMKQAANDLDVEWSAARKSVLLLGAAVLLMPVAVTLLVLALVLVLDPTQLWAMLITASVMFYAVVELAWRARQVLPRATLARLQARLVRDLTPSQRTVVQ